MTNQKLTDLHLILLSTAAGRDGGSLIPLPESVASDTARATKAIGQLIKKGLAEEADGAMLHDDSSQSLDLPGAVPARIFWIGNEIRWPDQLDLFRNQRLKFFGVHVGSSKGRVPLKTQRNIGSLTERGLEARQAASFD